MTQSWKVLFATHLIAAVVGHQIAPREMLETDVKQSGFFRVDSKRVLAAAVESLRSESKLLVYSYKAFASVSVERDGFLLLNGRQDLITPASVSYFVDLSRLTQDHVSFNEQAMVVTVRLAPLILGDIAFEPEGARTSNGGLLTFSQTEVDELSKLNYASARKAFTKQAQGAELVQAAKAQAIKAVESSFEIPFRAAGLADVQVIAVFDDT